MISHSLTETENFAKEFLNNLKPSESATVVGLSGDLGSGKTTFVQAVARLLGVAEKVNSPTFVLMKRYTLHSIRYTSLIHIDAYRLENGSDLEKLRISEIFAEPKNLVFIEWPEIVQSALPKNIQILKFRFVDETTREIES